MELAVQIGCRSTCTRYGCSSCCADSVFVAPQYWELETVEVSEPNAIVLFGLVGPLRVSCRDGWVIVTAIRFHTPSYRTYGTEKYRVCIEYRGRQR